MCAEHMSLCSHFCLVVNLYEVQIEQDSFISCAISEVLVPVLPPRPSPPTDTGTRTEAELGAKKDETESDTWEMKCARSVRCKCCCLFVRKDLELMKKSQGGKKHGAEGCTVIIRKNNTSIQERTEEKGGGGGRRKRLKLRGGKTCNSLIENSRTPGRPSLFM